MTRSEPAATESQVGPTLCLHCCLLCTHLVRRACGWNLSSHAAAWTQSSCTGNLFLKNNCLWPVCCCLHQKIVSGCSLCCCCCRRRCCFCFCCYANAVQIRERTHLSQYPCKTEQMACKRAKAMQKTLPDFGFLNVQHALLGCSGLGFLSCGCAFFKLPPTQCGCNPMQYGQSEHQTLSNASSDCSTSRVLSSAEAHQYMQEQIGCRTGLGPGGRRFIWKSE